MKKIIKIALGMAGMLLLTTLPAYCTTIALQISSTQDGTYNSSTGVGSFDVTTLIETGTLVGGGTYTNTINLPLADALLLSFDDTSSSSRYLTLDPQGNAVAPFKNLSTGNGALNNATNVYNASTSLAYSGTNLITGIQVTGTAISGLGAFLTDLYLPSNATLSLSGSISGAGSSIISDTLVLTTTADVETPEPSSVFLLGAGLLAIGAIARKRKLGTA